MKIDKGPKIVLKGSGPGVLVEVPGLPQVSVRISVASFWMG